jgi:hypothetical protein
VISGTKNDIYAKKRIILQHSDNENVYAMRYLPLLIVVFFFTSCEITKKKKQLNSLIASEMDRSQALNDETFMGVQFLDTKVESKVKVLKGIATGKIIWEKNPDVVYTFDDYRLKSIPFNVGFTFYNDSVRSVSLHCFQCSTSNEKYETLVEVFSKTYNAPDVQFTENGANHTYWVEGNKLIKILRDNDSFYINYSNSVLEERISKIKEIRPKFEGVYYNFTPWDDPYTVSFSSDYYEQYIKKADTKVEKNSDI